MKTMNKFFYCAILSIGGASVQAQTKETNDTIGEKVLDSVVVNSYINNKLYLPEVQETYLFAGKKSEVISLSQTDADLSSKIARQVFAKVPGLFVYDMDGTGNQINISTRGLDPHRGWEFNIRKDGVMTNSDMYGYPASHYSMPLESIDRIELVRGTGALQYGAQFGGMLSYISKQGDTTRPFSFESINTAGSFNLLSTYNAVGGKLGKFRYYAYFSRKSRDGYRQNEHTNSEADNLTLTYAPTHNLLVRAEWTRSAYTYRIPGALTDNMFYANPRQSTRSRNYFNPDIHIPSVTIKWDISAQTKLQLISSAVLGKRNSVMFDKPTNISDTINAATLQYNNRQVDIDQFNSYTTELRILHNYRVRKQLNTLAAGIQYMNNDLHRTQLGKGTVGSDFDLTLTDPVWGRDMHFKTRNLAWFAENKFQLTNRLSVTAGTRIEMGQTDMSGTINYYPGNKVPVTIKHHFPLYGAGFMYQMKGNMQLYGGWSQAYRPMIFKDLIPASVYEKVDPNIRDAQGYNVEAGFRGNWLFLKWDITGYLLRENNRFGTLAQTDNTGTLYLYRTNIGNSFTKGAEIFIQGDWLLGRKAGLTIFTSTSLMHARYTEAMVKSGNTNVNIAGNKVESAPDFTTRNGITLRIPKVSFSVLYSYTAATFADALNTVEPPATTGVIGLVPAYGIVDINASVRITKNIDCKINVNNLTNRQYFTKRPTFYPGPGIWPSDGRTVNFSIGVRL